MMQKLQKMIFNKKFELDENKLQKNMMLEGKK